MAKITKASLEQLAQEMTTLTKEEMRSIVGGTKSVYSPTSSTEDQSIALKALGNDPLSTQVGQDMENGYGSLGSSIDNKENLVYDYSTGIATPVICSTSGNVMAMGTPTDPPSKRVLDSGCFKGYQSNDPSGCLRRCQEMIGCDGESMSGVRIAMTQIESGALQTTSQFNRGISEIDQALRNGEPIIVGVHYDNHQKPSPNSDNMTNHFIVISGYHTSENGERIYEFFDPRTRNVTNGTTGNTLRVVDGKMVGQFGHGEEPYDYTVTTVRPNK